MYVVFIVLQSGHSDVTGNRLALFAWNFSNFLVNSSSWSEDGASPGLQRSSGVPWSAMAAVSKKFLERGRPWSNGAWPTPCAPACAKNFAVET
jgi:hypothetical protein